MEGQPINFLPGQPVLPPPVQPPKRRRSRVAFLLCTLLLIIGGLWWLRAQSAPIDANSPTAYDPVTLEPKKPRTLIQKLSYVVFNHDREPLAGEDEDRINILLLGMGGPGHDGPYLTDTIMIASIKPSTKQVALVSIPRDLMVNIPGYGFYKINHANHFGEQKQPDWGGAFATQVISDTFKLKIPYYVRIDFAAFQQIINEVGGVKVDVEKSFTDSDFPAANDAFQTVSFNKGIQTMDGTAALSYARSRHGNNGEGSDFARAKRQQKIILALREKVLSFGTLLNPVRINNIMDALESHLTTNLEFGELVSLAKLGRELNTDQITNLVFDTSANGYLINSNTIGMLEPRTGNFDSMATAVNTIFAGAVGTTKVSQTPSQDAPPTAGAQIEIQNGTWNAGLAARIKKRLTDNKIPVAVASNSKQKPIASSGIYVLGLKAPASTAETLAKELFVPIKQSLPTGITAATSTDILILLGDDFSE